MLYTDTERDGLEEIYRLESEYPDFRPLEIAGHPAVQATAGGADEFSCGIYVGLSDSQYLNILAQRAAGVEEDLCMKAEKVAELALSNIPGEA
ncbi:putative DUF3558 family protein [Actinoalloteichus hymeniacidonis]|uniref:DUF3558 family protein n=1 Tax=Actinoalloteichus hymeniacidonis TaxID=340345 RepID=A0AAC9HTD5_9PSEU|nr:putative DUF3558 family protein [Actinoalloteichus hymeniacidonis]